MVGALLEALHPVQELIVLLFVDGIRCLTVFGFAHVSHVIGAVDDDVDLVITLLSVPILFIGRPPQVECGTDAVNA